MTVTLFKLVTYFKKCFLNSATNVDRVLVQKVVKRIRKYSKKEETKQGIQDVLSYENNKRFGLDRLVY